MVLVTMIESYFVEQVLAQMQEPTFLDRASERMWKCEGLFAEAKQNHGLARAKYRGRGKVQIQAYLIAIVQNLKRLLFPIYCWLVACWSRLTRAIAHASPTHRMKPKISRKNASKKSTFSTGPTVCRDSEKKTTWPLAAE